MADIYTYSPIDSANGQIRLLTIKFDVKHTYGHTNVDPLVGSMQTCYLPIAGLSRRQRLAKSVLVPSFFALSYVWGNPARTNEITIDGKKHGITENLYGALRDTQRDAIGDLLVWADAICINQADLAERSSQVYLMRDVYHSSAQVMIWLGFCTEEGRRCLKFIADITGGYGYQRDPSPGSEELEAGDEKMLKAILTPVFAAGRAVYGFGQLGVQVLDALDASALDNKAEIILDPDGNLSLHRETVEELSKWRPSKRRLKKVQGENFREIAALIDKTFIQQCPWFERMWVVQELGVADSAGIAYGGGVESWKHFLRAVYYLHYTCDAPVANIRKLTGLEKIRLGWISGFRQPLRELIRECRYRRATDPRDKIFALLGLMGDGMNQYLRADYTKSVAEVYAHATQHLITQNESLDPICGWQTLGRDDLPSWVPDYNLNQDLVAASLVPIDGRDSLFAASGYDYQSKFLTQLQVESWKTLPVTGYMIDTISLHSEPMSEDEEFGSMEMMWHSTISAAGHLFGGLSEDIERGLIQISSLVGQYSERWHSKEKPYAHSIHSSSQVNISLEDDPEDDMTEDQGPLTQDSYVLDAYLHSLVCGRQTPRERLSKRSARFIMSQGASASDEIKTIICHAFEAGMRGRSLGITTQGYIGAMPQDIQSGDLVCVLFGCSVPVVLRELGDIYVLVGNCYLHGFMDAEAIVFHMKGHLQQKSFVLS